VPDPKVASKGQDTIQTLWVKAEDGAENPGLDTHHEDVKKVE
jgi:hypothetical protein